MPLGQAQEVQCADRIDEMRLNRVSHVAFGTGRAGEVVDLVDVIEEFNLVRDVEIVVTEVLVVLEVLDIGMAAGDEIIDGDDIMSITEKPVAKM
jgi:hypothetical protein